MTNAEVVTEVFPPDQEPWKAIEDGEFAIVELFGHTTMVGRIAEVERFGAKMLALEPIFGGKLLPAVFHGGAAIYRFTPCSRQVAWERQPKETYQLPAAVRASLPPAALSAPATFDEAARSRDDEDLPY